jgi:hypothetical protein
MRVLSILSLSAVAATIFAPTANAQEISFSYGGVEITSAPPEAQLTLPRKPDIQFPPEASSRIQLFNGEQDGLGRQDEYRLKYRFDLSPRFSTSLESPLIQETSTMRRGFEISGSPRIRFSVLWGVTDPNKSMSEQRSGVNYNSWSDPNIDQSALSVFDRENAKRNSQTAIEIYGIRR